MAYMNYFGQAMATTPWHSKTITGSTQASAASTMLNGTSGGDNFIPNAVGAMAGGSGDDMYQYVTMAKKVVETANGGVDTVYVNSRYVMPDNIENLTIWYAPSVKGNALGNLMLGSGGAETFNGAGGNDVLAGKGGHDIFRFDPASGYDVVADFVTTGADSDIVRLAGYTKFTRFDQVKAAMTQSGSDVILKLDGANAVKFSNHAVADFTADNFQLGLDLTGYRLTFADEFNSLSLWDGGKSGTWRTDYGVTGNRDDLGSRTLTNNREQEIYIDAAMKGAGKTPIGISPFSIDEGVLTITASPTPENLKSQLYDMNYVSGLLTTKQSFAQQYGYFEARLDIPEGSGLWPAFWLLPANGAWPPEIDIMESYGTAEAVFTAHSAATGTHTQASASEFDPSLLSGFHTYGMLWTAKTLSWYLDGVKVFEQATPPDLNKPMYMLVNLAVTGTAATGMTGELQVDYVRAYALPDAPLAIQTMAGSTTDDVFVVTSSEDTITEKAGGGNDRVTAHVDYTLPANVEDLVLAGDAVRGTGNARANTIIGNARDNLLEGGGGKDDLDGGAGADRMVGGAGHDTFHVDNARDVVVELAGEGNDTVYSSVDYTLPIEVETVTLTGGAVRATGNAAANTLTGNTLDNVLIGGGGNDTLVGGAGHDRFVFAQGFGKDVISDFAVGEDSIDWSALAAQKAPVIKASGGGSVVSFGADSITLLGVTPSELAAHHVFG